MRAGIARLTITAVAALGLGVAAAGSASAQSIMTWAYAPGSPAVGYGIFNENPGDGIPGDAIQACDKKADGYGIDMRLAGRPDADHIIRHVDTRGHAADYCTPWGEGSGNLPEDTRFYIQACLVKGSYRSCGPWDAVES